MLNIASGTFIFAEDTRRFLLLLRNRTHKNMWALAGGKSQDQETTYQTILRECKEELGFIVAFKKLAPLNYYLSDDQNFNYVTWCGIVQKEFSPKLNDEHAGYAWVASGCWPKPLHPGVFKCLTDPIFESKLEEFLNYNLPTTTSITPTPLAV